MHRGVDSSQIDLTHPIPETTLKQTRQNTSQTETIRFVTLRLFDKQALATQALIQNLSPTFL